MTANDIVALFAPFIAAILLAAAILRRRLHRARPARAGAARHVHGPDAGRASSPWRRGRSRRRTPSRQVTAFSGAYIVDDADDVPRPAVRQRSSSLTVAFAPDYLEERGLPIAEFAAVLVFAMSGAMLIAGSGDLLVLFLGLELMVLPGYMLAGYHKSDGYSTEGAIKYFLLGLVLERDLPVRPRVRVGHHRHDQHRRGRGDPRRDRERRGRLVARPRHGPRVPDDRRRVQDRRRPVPLLDAGRVPGLADAGHRLPLGRAQDRARSR